MAAPREVVILGGGISGLTTAWAIVRASAQRAWRGGSAPCPRITVVERDSDVGGCIKTHRGPGGAVLEQGPRGVRPSGAAGRATINLVASLGLADDVVVAGKDHSGAANRFVYAGGRLNKLPSGFIEACRNLARRDPLTTALVKGILTEPFASRANPARFSSLEAAAHNDETVFDFASRRLGRDVAATLVDALCVGVYGGDSRKLSLRSCFPLLAEFERLEGSLALGAIRQDANTPPLPPPEPGTEALLECVKGARLWSLQQGMGGVVSALRGWLEGTGAVGFRAGESCTGLSRAPSKQASGGQRVRVRLSGGDVLEADHVVSALPAHALAAVLEREDPAASAACGGVAAGGIVVANYMFRGSQLGVDGFGYLVPTTEPEPGVLGVVFDSCAFPQQDDTRFLDAEIGSVTRLTVMTGGCRWSEVYGGTGGSTGGAGRRGVAAAASSKRSGSGSGSWWGSGEGDEAAAAGVSVEEASSDGAPDDETVHALSRRVLREHLGITAGPVHSAVKPWVNCMPQYTVGHASRVAAIEGAVRDGWGGTLSVTGSSYRGVGVNDCVMAATRLGTELVESGRV